MKRFILIVTLLVLALMVAAAVLLSALDSERLGRTVLHRAGDHLGLELAAERFDFHLLRGLEIEGLTARGTLPAGALDARLGDLTLRHELWPLLSRRLVVRELVMTEPRIELVETPGGSAAPEPQEPAPAPVSGQGSGAGASEPAPTTGGIQLQIHRVRLTGGEVVLLSADPEVAPTEVRGLDLTLEDVVTGTAQQGSHAGFGGLRARGTLKVAEARSGELQGTDGRGEVVFEDGHLRLTRGRLTLDAGPVQSLELDLDLTREPFGYELALGADPLETGVLLQGRREPEGQGGPGEETGVEGGPESGFGPSRLTFRAEGRGAGLEAMQADGTLAVDGGTLPVHPVLAGIDALVEGAGLVGAQYLPVDVEFEVRDGRVELRPFRLVAGGTTLDVRGTAVPGGPWDLWLALAVPRRGIDIEELPRELLDILTDDEGRLHLPLRVSGNVDRMQVVPDPQALAEATRQGARRRLQDRLQENLSRGLRSLFGDRDEPREEPGDDGGGDDGGGDEGGQADGGGDDLGTAPVADDRPGHRPRYRLR